MARAYLGLGSNLGDRRAHLQHAVRALARHGTLLARSPIIETQPVDCPYGGTFLNACVCLDTDLAPRDLLGAAQRIERERGRRGDARNAPRTLDIDLLLVDDLCLAERRLVLPHPRMCERRFVLEPLVAIAPRAVHPLMRLTARQLLERLLASNCD